MNSGRIIDLGLSRGQLSDYLREIGYWATPGLERRHGYVLSDTAYALSRSQEIQLDEIAVAAHRALGDLGARLAQLAARRSPTHEEAAFLKLARTGVRGLLAPGDIDEPTPPIIKVDLMIDTEGRFQIAEIDAYNPRGLGFIALLDESAARAGKKDLSTVDMLARTAHARVGRDTELLVIVSDFERYYETTYRILVRAFCECGVRARLVSEESLQEALGTRDSFSVFAIPDTLGMSRGPHARDTLLRMYRNGELRTIYPPVAYLGSKAFLPYLRTREEMERFIPESTLVGKKHDPWLMIDRDAPSVLKGVVSSGLKQVIFSDEDGESFEKTLAIARNAKTPLWMLQRQVPQRAIPICVFADDGARLTRDYYLRFTAYMSAEKCIGAAVTGRTDKKVHGAPDCVMIPVVRE